MAGKGREARPGRHGDRDDGRGGRRWLALLFLAAAVGFAVWVLWGRWEELGRLRSDVASFPWRIDLPWLLTAVGLAILDLFLMAAVWVYLYRAAGGSLGYGRGLRVWMATNLGRYIPGKIWQVTGLAYHMRRTGGSGTLALTSSVTFQVVVLLTGTAVGAATVGAGLEVLPVASPLAGAVILLAALALLHPAVVRRTSTLLARWLGEEEPGAAPAGELAAAGCGMLVAWLLYGAGLWALLRGLTPGDPGDPLLMAGVFAASYVAGYLVLVAPGGLVVREGAMTALLAAFTPLSAPVAAVVAVAARIWVTGSELCALAAAFAPGALGRGGGA